MHTIVELIKETIHDWMEDKAPRLSAALAYYTMFAIPPLLALLVLVAGAFFGREAVTGRMLSSIQGVTGARGATAVRGVLQQAGANPHQNAIGQVIAIVLLLFGAIGVFQQLKDALNTIWGVEPKPGRGIKGFIKDYVLSFAMLLGTGFLLLVSLVVSTALTALGTFLSRSLPGGSVLWHVVNILISIAVIACMFALLFKYMPQIQVRWKDIWVGAIATAVLFLLGQYAVGIYLGRGTVGSSWGAAGSVIVLLVWVYYSSLILFLGAEFTKVYTNRLGSHAQPEPDARPVTQEEQQEQGIPRRRQA